MYVGNYEKISCIRVVNSLDLRLYLDTRCKVKIWNMAEFHVLCLCVCLCALCVLGVYVCGWAFVLVLKVLD